MSLPTELQYSKIKPTAAPSTPHITQFSSQNQSYVSGSIVRFEIPTGLSGNHIFPKHSFVSGQVSLNVSTLAATAQNVACNSFLDQSIYSLFKKLTISHGGTTQEEITNCNRAWTAIYDLQKSKDKRLCDSINLLVDETDPLQGLTFSVLKSTVANTASVQSTVFVDFAFVLPSSILGLLASRDLPVSLMGASSLTLELELESAQTAFTGSANITSINSFTLQNLYYNAKMVHLDPAIEIALINSTAGVVQMPAVTYKTEYKTLSAGSTSFNDKFTHQYNSVKNFCYFLQSQATFNGSLLSKSISSRPNCGINNWYISIGGNPYPPKAITGYTNIFMETLRAWDMMNSEHGSGVLGRTNYTTGTGAVGEEVLANNYRFIAAVDLDRYNHSSELLVTGTNTFGQSIDLNFTLDAPAAVNLIVYTFCMIDVLYTIQNGVLVKSV